MVNKVAVKLLVVLGQASSGLEQVEYHMVKFIDLFCCLGKALCRSVSVSCKISLKFLGFLVSVLQSLGGGIRKSSKIISKLLVVMFSVLQSSDGRLKLS